MLSKVFAIDEREDVVDEIVSLYNAETVSEGGGDIIKKGRVNIQTFADGEITVQYKEAVRGHRVYLVCSTGASDNIMKLMLAIDAAKRASADEIVAVIPYFGYARQDQKDGIRGAIGAKVIASMLQAVGVTRVIVIDLHADQIQGFFDTPIDHIKGHYIFTKYLKGLIGKTDKETKWTLCSPDAGGVKRVDKFFKRFDKYENVNLAILSKRRDRANSIKSMELIGDVKDSNVIIIDDMVDTAGTLCKAAEAIMEAGATSVRSICTHGIFSGDAHEKIQESPLLEIIVSDSLTQSEGHEKVRVIRCERNIVKIMKAIANKVSADTLSETAID